MSSGSNHHYLECIRASYDFASGELLNLVREKVRYFYLRVKFYQSSFFNVSSNGHSFFFFELVELHQTPMICLHGIFLIRNFSFQYDLMGKLRSMKHYLLLDQVCSLIL